ncbi:MAG: efflux RND transporter periplasmic adaptor subunit [Planctomycetota bacterium]
MKIPGILLTILVGISASWAGYSKYYGANTEDAFVTKALDKGDIVQTVSATGTVEPVTKVIISSQISGNIISWHADFNAKVAEGFVLAEIEADRYVRIRNQSQAELALAKAREEEAIVRYKDAQRESHRIESLRETSNASDNEMLVAKAAEEAALALWHGSQASVKSAEAGLGAAEVDLGRTKIRSPINGVVISRSIDVGQTVAASLQAPELFIIANDLAKMQVNANVAESDVGLIKESGKASFRVDAYPGRVFTGVISQIRYNPTILDNVVTYVTVISVNNDELLLRPGMTANITFEVGKAEAVVRIPNAALRFTPFPPDPMQAMQGRRGPKVPQVWVLEKGEPKPVDVKVGMSDGANTQLVSGEIKESTPVIVERSWKGRMNQKPDVSQAMRMPGR